MFNFIHLPLILICIFNTALSSQETLFYCSNETGTYQVKSVNLETSEITNITSNSDYNYWWVDVSADKDKLVLMRSPVGDGIDDKFDYWNCQMLTTDIDGTNESIIVDDDQHGWVLFGNPRWHPKEDRLLLFAFDSSPFSQYIFAMNSDGTNPVKLTNDASSFSDPNWSHDGNKIVYVGLNPSGGPMYGYEHQEIFSANYDYETNTIENETQLTDDLLIDNNPCFSLDDELIVFSSGDEELTYADLVAINIDGSNRASIIADDNINGGSINWGSNDKIYYHSLDMLDTLYGIKEYDPNTNNNLNFSSTQESDLISPRFVNFSEPSSEAMNKKTCEISIFPNPVSTYLDLKVEEQSINGELHIYSVTGELLLSHEINSIETRIDLRQLPSGNYTALFAFQEGSTTSNFIKVN